MGFSIGRSVTVKACAAALVLSLPAAGGVAWADGAAGVSDSGKAAAFAAETGALSGSELGEIGIAVTSDAGTIVDWTACGTCEWMIDGTGCLTIRPANGAESGALANWGTSPWNSYAAKIKAVNISGKVKAQTLRSAFTSCANLASANLSGLDTSSVMYMDFMFYGCSSLASLDVSGWDTSSVADMGYMFSGCSKLAALDLSGWDTSSVANMGSMFCYCPSLTTLDVSGFDTSKVTNMWNMFRGCSSLTTLDVSGWDTSSATYMSSMFYGCTSLAALDVSGWDVSSAADMGYMFDGCSSLRTVSLGEKFEFKTDSDGRKCELPTPVGDGLTGKWVSSADGKAYTPAEIPSNVAATYTAQQRIAKTIDASMFTVDTSDATYTGQAVRPDRVTSAELSEGADYKVEYSDYVNAGTAKITITGIGGYTGTLSYTYTVNKAKPNRSTQLGIARVKYGTTLGELNLEEGYSWNDDPSTPVGDVGSHVFYATYTPADTANYEIVRDVTVQIGVVASPIDDSMFTVDTSDAVYTGSAVAGRVASKDLEEGVDYEVWYTNNTDTGTAKIAISGKGNYTGTLTYSFRIVAPTPAQTFPDVDYAQWYADGVTFCAEKGLITGYTKGDDAGKFGVGRTLTRAELAAILWRNAEPEAAAAYDADADNATGLPDVGDREWYTGAANWAVSAGVINGVIVDGHREFRPDDAVTAEQLAAILANYADPAGAENADLGVLDGFADAGTIGDWARGSVAWAKSKGIINGYDENGVRFLKPYEQIARERVATILMNAFESGVME